MIQLHILKTSISGLAAVAIGLILHVVFLLIFQPSVTLGPQDFELEHKSSVAQDGHKYTEEELLSLRRSRLEEIEGRDIDPKHEKIIKERFAIKSLPVFILPWVALGFMYRKRPAAEMAFLVIAPAVLFVPGVIFWFQFLALSVVLSLFKGVPVVFRYIKGADKRVGS